MALQDLYGIGKGEAQVFSQKPMLDLLAEERAVNRDRYAKQQAKKASKAAALNALDDKLKVEGHHSHQKFIQDNLDELHNYATEMYGKHGETVFADNSEAKAEWKSKINDFKKYNSASKNIKTALQAQIDRSMSTDFEMDDASVKSFNDYMNLPLDEQIRTGLPTINERDLTVEELFEEGPISDLMKNTVKEFGYDTKPTDGGEYKRIAGVSIDKDKYNAAKTLALKNPKSPTNRAIYKEQQEIMDGHALIPRTIRDEQGNEVENPEYLDVLNQRVEQRIDNLMETHVPREKYTTTRKTVPGAAKKVTPTITEVTESERGYTRSGAPKAFKGNVFFSKGATDTESGKKYFKTKNPIYVYNGQGYTRENLPVEAGEANVDVKPIQIGSWVDESFNVKPDESNLREAEEAETFPVKREVTIQDSPKKDIRVTELINPDGTVEKIAEGRIIEKGQLVAYHKKEVTDVDGKIVHKGEKGFDEGKKRTIQVATIKTKDAIYETEVTPEIREQFKESFTQIGEDEPEEEVKAEDLRKKYNY